MKRAYTQLTEKERQEIARTRLLGWSSHTSGRWWLPKGTDIGTVSAAQRHQIMHALNDRPRKQLGWRTPAEKMAELFRARAAPLGGIAVIKEFIDY